MTSPPGGLAFSLMKPAGAGACAAGRLPSRFPLPFPSRALSLQLARALSPRAVERIPLAVGCHGGVSDCDGCGETALVGRATKRPPPLPGSPSPPPSPQPPCQGPLSLSPSRSALSPHPHPRGNTGSLHSSDPLLASSLTSASAPRRLPGAGRRPTLPSAAPPFPPPPPGPGEDMAAHRPVEWVQAAVSRFDEQLPIKTGQQNTHTKVSTEHNTECLINISKYKFSLLISGLTTVLKNVNNMRIFGEAAEKNLYLSQLIILDTLEKCLAGQPKDTMRLDETMLVKQLLPETCHFLHTCREGNQHAAELRNSASGVLFSLSCNNFNAVFSCISTRLQELTVCSEDNVDVHDIELLQYINVDCAKLKRLLKECAEKLFDLVDGFAESTKRKAAVWPPQIILLILCPEIIQDISKDVVDENNMNKVDPRISFGSWCLSSRYEEASRRCIYPYLRGFTTV
nr:neurofibromin-like [Pongo pygmaeus]